MSSTFDHFQKVVLWVGGKMGTINLHYEGASMFLQKALQSFNFSGNTRGRYDDLYIIDLACHNCLSTLIVLLNRLYVIKGNERVLLVSSKKSHLPQLPAFSIYLESALSEWWFALANNGKMITEIVDECHRIKNLEKMTVKSRLILRQLAEGYSIDDLAELMEISTKSIRATMWRCSLLYGFNCTDRLIAYLMGEYSNTLKGQRWETALTSAEGNIHFIIGERQKIRDLSSEIFFV